MTKEPTELERPVELALIALRHAGHLTLAAELEQATASLRERVAELEAHIREHITFAETRIKDGAELGATVWRIALEDIARENRAKKETAK